MAAPVPSAFRRRAGLSTTRVRGYTSVVRPVPPEPSEPEVDADQVIIDRILAGDRDAFGILISRYSDPLYRHAYGMTGSADVAEDILQVSFIKAFHHLGEVRGRFEIGRAHV